MLKTKASYLLLFIVMVFMSCQKKEEKQVNTLTLNFQEGDLTSLHPHQLMIYLRGISLGKHLYEGLTRIDDQGKPQLAGAQSIDVTEDGLNYVIQLRANNWSDGSAVTAMDYENAWKEALSPTSNCPRADLLYMLKNGEQAKKGEIDLESIGVKAIDDQILLIELAHPSPYFLELLAQPICAPLADVSAKEPTKFNGPFEVIAWKHNDYLHLTKNPHYWDKDQMTLENLRIYMVQDTMTAFTMYQKDQIDWIGVPFVPLSNEIITQLKKQKALKSHPVDRAFWVFLNTQHPALSSVSVRQALNLAFDRKAVTDHIFAAGKPLEKPLPTALLNVTHPSKLREDLVAANQFLEQGLKELNLTRETFPSLTITYSQQAGRKQLAEYLQQAWSKGLNIRVNSEPQEWNIFRVNLGEGNYEISGSFEAPFYNDPLELMQKFVTRGPNNFPQWTNPAFIDTIAQARHETDPHKRQELLANAEQIMMEEVPFIPVSSDEFIFSHQPGLKGYVFDCVGACDFSRATLTK